MFAGPNGSGKTTVKNSLGKPATWFGLYVNPDEIEAIIRRTGVLPLEQIGLFIDADEVRQYFQASSFLASKGLSESAGQITSTPENLDFRAIEFNSYHASVLSDFLRRAAMRALLTFSFETVMSSEDKVELLHEAQSLGYRTYLYYVATANPAINVQRVKSRVASGGHDVPEEKVVARYGRSLDLLSKAIAYADRAFLFDTSEEQAWYFAEITNGESIRLQSDEIPSWFQPIWDSLAER